MVAAPMSLLETAGHYRDGATSIQPLPSRRSILSSEGVEMGCVSGAHTIRVMFGVPNVSILRAFTATVCPL